MGFVNNGLGPADLGLVTSLQPEIIATLRKAATRIRQAAGPNDPWGAKALSKKWFGDDTDLWLKDLAAKLDRTASFINVKPIRVSFMRISGRCGEDFAEAAPPAAGWKDFTGGTMTQAQGQNFRITLNLLWNGAPRYRVGGRPGDSKFQTLVHECTHLILDTDDDEYGVASCELLAMRNPAAAKKTADNWGYFVEEFR